MRKNQKKMKVAGNDISVFSFMFASGTAAGIFMSWIPGICPISFYTAILSALAAAIYPKSYLPALLSAFFFAGITGSSMTVLYASIPENCHVADIANSAAAALKGCIDSIPFENTNNNAVIKAFITGDKSDMPEHLVTSFRKSGAAHLLALSGLHLGILYLIFSRLLSIVGNSPVSLKIRALIIISASGFYTLTTGAGPSIVRAFLFICINETGKCLRRENPPMNTFSAALAVHLVFTPESITHAGFQLSYSAMAGIYLLYPHIKLWYPLMCRIFSNATLNGKTCFTVHPSWNKLQTAISGTIQKLWNTIALSLSCQAFTAPIAWLHFKSFPVYFLITNLTAGPLTTVVINLSIPLIILQATGTCPKFLVKTVETAINLLTGSIEIIAGLGSV